MQGLILLNKPKGITSFSAVSSIKRIAAEKRVGHTGTLDPMAIGVLPILLGRATALSSLMLDGDKTYRAEIKLGVTTDTDDITGNVLSENQVNLTDTDIDNALNHFLGEITQIPPIYSAIKKDGVRLYKLAREGRQTEIPERRVNIHSITRLCDLTENNTFSIDASVSKGTYIRSLARDIGEYLGCGATLSQLERRSASGFDITDTVTLEELKEKGIENCILNEETAVSHLRAISITQRQAVRFTNGGQLSFERLNLTDYYDGELFRIKYADKLLGIGFADANARQIGIKCIINYPE